VDATRRFGPKQRMDVRATAGGERRAPLQMAATTISVVTPTVAISSPQLLPFSTFIILNIVPFPYLPFVPHLPSRAAFDSRTAFRGKQRLRYLPATSLHPSAALPLPTCYGDRLYRWRHCRHSPSPVGSRRSRRRLHLHTPTTHHLPTLFTPTCRSGCAGFARRLATPARLCFGTYRLFPLFEVCGTYCMNSYNTYYTFCGGLVPSLRLQC